MAGNPDLYDLGQPCACRCWIGTLSIELFETYLVKAAGGAEDGANDEARIGSQDIRLLRATGKCILVGGEPRIR